MLRHDAFEVMLAGHAVKTFAVVFQMIAIEQPLTVVHDGRTKASFTFAQWGISQIVAVAPNQIKGNESRFASSEQQVTKLRLAVLVEANNLAIENR
jgi:hypothetical protein